jgi:hypothetical protein
VHPFFGAPTASDSVAQSFGTYSTQTFRVASLTLERSISGIAVTLSEGANLGSLATVVSYNDTTSAITNFNIFSLYFTTTSENGDMRYDNVNVALVAVPEPSTAAALIGVTALAFTAMRRRRHN